MTENREQEALKAYLKLLLSKGATSANLERRMQFLVQLEPSIAGKPCDGSVYRNAVEELLDKTDKTEWPFCLLVAREYFPFWTQDIKAITALNSGSAFDIQPFEWQPLEANLKTLWGMLDKEQFSTTEKWPLKAYTHALRQEGATQLLVDTRVKLVKLLLVRLKDAPEKNHKIYRVAVDFTVPLFTMKETRRLFLAVVREFYYFWIGDPEAAKYILNDKATSLL